MGAHVFLTGLRGLTAPFVGTWLFTHYGSLAFVVAVVLALMGLLVFRSLAQDQREKSSTATKVETGMQHSRTAERAKSASTTSAFEGHADEAERLAKLQS